MKRLTDIFKTINVEENKISQPHNSLSNYMRIQIGGELNVSTQISEDKLDSIKDKLRAIQNELELNDSRFTTQNVIPFEKDETLDDFVFILDCISAFSEITKIYFENDKNKNNWYANEIKKELDNINAYVNQLALCLTFLADTVSIDLKMDVNEFDTKKELATLIKQNGEYSKFKKLVKKRMNFENQPMNIRALSNIIIGKCKDLIKII